MRGLAKPDAGNAFGRAVASILTAVVVSKILIQMAETGVVSSLLVHVIIFGMTLGTLTMMSDMKYWNLEYMTGWAFGILLMIQSGVLGGLSLLMHIMAIGGWLYLFKL